MKRVPFAPSPTGSLHIGNAVANRAPGDRMLLRIDDTDVARYAVGGRDLVEARAHADAVLNPPSNTVLLGDEGAVTVERFQELRARARRLDAPL